MFTVLYEITGDEEVRHDLLGIGMRAQHLEPVLSFIAGQLEQRVADQFDEGQGNWAPLAESTVAHKAREGLDPRILHATESMRRSFTEDDHPDHIEVIGSDELHWGSADPKAGFHQGGTDRMPARRILDLTPYEMRDYTREIQRYLIGLEGGLGQDVPVWLR